MHDKDNLALTIPRMNISHMIYNAKVKTTKAPTYAKVIVLLLRVPRVFGFSSRPASLRPLKNEHKS